MPVKSEETSNESHPLHHFCRIPYPVSPASFHFAAGLLLTLAACSPTLNWREVRADTSSLRFLLPCKPDKAQKQVPLGPTAVQLNMLGCDAGGATFAVAWAELAPGADTAAVLSQWEQLSLQNMRAAAPVESQPLKVVGAASAPAPRLTLATGQTADGKPVQGRAAYFSSGSQIFQAVMYAPKISPEAADTFFSSLRLQ
jgi:hypothetical protein